MKNLRNISLLIAGFIILSLGYTNCSSSFEPLGSLASIANPPGNSNGGTTTQPPPPLPDDLSSFKDAPASFQLEDWTSGSAVLVGTIQLNARMPDLTFDDPEIQADLGEVAVLNSTQSISWRGFEFGGISFVSAGLGEGGRPLYQVLFGAKPSGRWSTYPFADTFNSSTDLTIPPAFKVVIRDYENNIIGRLQMRDGKPINDPSLSQTRSDTQALRPFFNCGMLLPWSNIRAKLNPNPSKYFPGFKLPSASQAKAPYAANPAVPLLGLGANGRVQVNSINHFFLMPQWPMNATVTSGGDPTLDPYVLDPDRVYTGDGGAARAFRATGWDYEPGSISGHDWLTGPGGVRFDRAPIPAAMAYLISDPTFRRPKDNRPIAELAHSWGLAYFNHSNSYLTDVKSFRSIMNDEATILEHSFMNSYYGRGPFKPLGRSIDQRAISNGDYRLDGNNGGTPDSFFHDRNGNRFWGGYAVDDHHAHQTPYYHVMFSNSPMHIVASRSTFLTSILSRLGGHHSYMRSTNDWSGGPSYSNANTRVQAWRWLHYTLAWKLSTSHPLGISRATILKLFRDDLHDYYDNILTPTMTEAKNPFHVAFKNLGMYGDASEENGMWVMRLSSPIAYYHSTVFLLMKRLGIWDELRRDTKSKASLDFVFNSLSKYSIDLILDTNGRAEDPGGAVAVTLPVANFSELTADKVPTSWAQWAQRFPAQGQESWTKQADGSFIQGYAAQHIRAQWAIMVRDWFPEMNYPRAAQAAAKYETFYSERTQFVNSFSNPLDQTGNDFVFKTISYGPFASP